MITLTPLSASAATSSTSEPRCYLFELDDARILLDLGQRDYRASMTDGDKAYENRIKEIAPSISLVLLSHSPSLYLGLYPYARSHWGLTCPVYATQATVEMGRVVCLSEAESWRSEVNMSSSTLPIPTVEQIHEAFDWIKPIRYNQPLHLGGDLAHLLLTPFPSGHTLGGTLFKIRSPTSGTVLYATGINHTGERHLDGMVSGAGYDEGLIRPDLLIVEGGRAEVTNPKRKDREKAFIDTVTSTLYNAKSVLVPTDPSPRLLELLVLLDQHWTYMLRARGTWNYPLCLVSRTAQDMVNFAKSLIEWMGGVVRDNAAGEEILAVAAGRKGKKRQDNTVHVGALDFRNVKLFSSPMELLQTYPVNRAKMVLAIPPSMSHGPSRWLFTAMAATEGNVILLTSQGEEGTLARELYDAWALQGKELGSLATTTGQKLVELHSKVPLAGKELDEHLESERQQKEREAATQAAADRSRRMLEADDLESDSDSDSDDEADDAGVAIIRSGANDYTTRETEGVSFDIYVKGQQTRSIGRQAMARFRMFPHTERRSKRIDDYGEGLDVGQWLRKGREIAEEGETEEVREAKRRKVEEDERKKAPPEPPSKFIVEKADVPMKASLCYVDMEGLHDGQAIKTIIADLQPRKMIIINSSSSATSNLSENFAQTIGSSYIYAPTLGETIRIGEHVQSYSLMLGDSISSLLTKKWAKFEGYEVAMVDGRISLSAGSTVPRLELVVDARAEGEGAEMVTESKVAEIGSGSGEGEVQTTSEGADESMVVKKESSPLESPGTTKVELSNADHKPIPKPKTKLLHSPPPPPPLPASLFVGDLRLAALKSRLNALDIPAEFAGEGVLVCGPGVKVQMDDGPAAVKAGSMVAVRKVGEGEVVVEGSAGRVYWDVRKEVYKSLALVGAA